MAVYTYDESLKTAGQNNFNYSYRDQRYASRGYTAYESVGVTVSSGSSNFSLKDHTTLFNSLHTPYEFLIRNNTSMEFSIKLNSSDNGDIPIYANSDLGFDQMAINDIFVTAASGNVSFNIITRGWR